MTTRLSRSQIGMRSPVCVTHRSSQDGTTSHYNGPSPWTTSRSVGGRGIDRSSPQRFRDTCDHRYCRLIWLGTQAWHMDGNRWCDIAYSAGACPHGVRFAGRGPGVRHGANGTRAGNDRSYSVQYMAGQGDPLTVEAQHAMLDEAAYLGAPLRWEHADWKPTECSGHAIRPWRRAGFPRPGGGTPTPPSEGDWLDMVSKAEFRSELIDVLDNVLDFNGRVSLLTRAQINEGVPAALAGPFNFNDRVTLLVIAAARLVRDEVPGQEQDLAELAEAVKEITDEAVRESLALALADLTPDAIADAISAGVGQQVALEVVDEIHARTAPA